jgi:UDP-glucose 4-epimerase
MTLSLVVGAGGLMGSALCRHLATRGEPTLAARVRWGTDQAGADLADAVTQLGRALTDGESWRVYWCAGAGVVATGPEALREELTSLETLADAVAALAGRVDGPGTVFFASSAGGIYAGSAGGPFDESTEPAPLAPYGRLKLAQEAALTQVLDGRTAIAIGRVANLYGPGQNLAKPQGLISQLCLAYHTGRPVGLYVSLDTRRDYLYVADAAAQVAALADVAARRGTAGAPVLKVLASGRSTTIGAILAELRRLERHPPRVIISSSPSAKAQATDLRLRSAWGPEIDALARTCLPEGIAATMEDIGHRWRLGR